jgi:hypothetical protein
MPVCCSPHWCIRLRVDASVGKARSSAGCLAAVLIFVIQGKTVEPQGRQQTERGQDRLRRLGTILRTPFARGTWCYS